MGAELGLERNFSRLLKTLSLARGPRGLATGQLSLGQGQEVPLWAHFQLGFGCLSLTLCPRLFPWPLLHSEMTKRPGWDSRSDHGLTDVSKSGSGVSFQP